MVTKLQHLDHDEALLQELGRRLIQFRIDLNQNQAELAKRAGVGLLEKIEMAIPEPTARPSRTIKKADALPQRVTRKRIDPTKAEPWKWGDES